MTDDVPKAKCETCDWKAVGGDAYSRATTHANFTQHTVRVNRDHDVPMGQVIVDTEMR